MAFTRILGPGIHTASNINSHNLNSTGIITAVSFVGDGSGLTGVASTDSIITGTAATFTGGVNINSDLDVDGHTNLDNVSIAGVTTFAGGLTGTTANFSGDVTVGGVLTYEDVKNVDSVGLITARNGINVSGGNVTIANDFDVDGHTNLDNVNVVGVVTASAGFRVPDGNYNTNLIGLGNHEDFIIYHDTAHTYAENKVGDFRLKADTIKITSRTGTESFIQADVNNAVRLFYDNSQKMLTSSTGINVNFRIAAIGDENTYVNLGSPADQWQFFTGGVDRLYLTGGPSDGGTVQIRGDNNKLQIGASQDLELYHDGNGDSNIFNNTGHLTITNNTSGKIINLQPKSGANGIIARYEGAAELYHNGKEARDNQHRG